jgi:hypothetical protein
MKRNTVRDVVAVLASSTGKIRRLTQTPLHPFPSANAENYQNREHSDPGAHLCEQFAMAGVKRQFTFYRHFDFACEHALSKRGARFIAQYLSDAAELIHKTGHTCIRRPDHWPTIFDAAEDCVHQMLLRPGGMQEPGIIC